jgi:Big-like domain-containing protein
MRPKVRVSAKGEGGVPDNRGMPIAPPTSVRIALLLVTTALLALAVPATSSAAGTTASASAAGKRALSLCSKRVGTSGNGAAQRRRATRRCVANLLRSTSRGKKDTTAPTVGWKTPAAGATLSGKLEGSACEAVASDDRGVDLVVMEVDGAALNTERSAPYNCYFDTTQVSDGSHTLTATAYDAAGNSRTAAVTVTVANAAAPAPAPEPAPAPSLPPSGGLVIGIDGGYAGWSSTETAYRAQLGATVTRHEWDPADPVNAQDALVLKAAAQVHTRIHALLGANELGAATHYREWVVAFIRRYGLGGTFWDEHPELDEATYAIRTFELGNEPYFGGMSASLYADTVRPTLEAVKSLGLPGRIILPSRVYGTDTSWMDTLYARIPNLNSYFYAFADHPYWYGHDPAQVSAAGPFGRIDMLRKRMNEKGASDKPIFITEYGESTANCGSECVSEAVQAEHLSALLNAAITRTSWKVEMVSVFQLLDRGTNSTDRELQFGLLRQNGAQKPSYPIVRGLIQQYRG